MTKSGFVKAQSDNLPKIDVMTTYFANNSNDFMSVELRGVKAARVYIALGNDDDSVHRYIVEEGFKPPIFGSYSYDPLRQVFAPRHKQQNDSLDQIVNKTFVLSTAVGTTSGEAITDPIYRQRDTQQTTRTTPWWNRKIKTNFTKPRRLF